MKDLKIRIAVASLVTALAMVCSAAAPATAREMSTTTFSGGAHTSIRPMGAAACVLSPGLMWKRASGGGFPSGAVGSKPKFEQCTPGIKSTKLVSKVYMQTWWGWAQVAGPFTSYGAGNMEQKSVMYRCNGTTWSKFRVLTQGTITFTSVHTFSDEAVTKVTDLACG